MNQSDHFDNFYKNNPGHRYEISLKKFYLEIVQKFVQPFPEAILDVGCGSYSIFEDVKTEASHITAIDLSENAIRIAPESQVIYKNNSVLNQKNFSNNIFDLVFDSHCFHCLDNLEQEMTLENIYNWLKPGGIFACEIMVQPTNRYVAIPYKNIRKAFEIEEGLLKKKFKILYFKIENDLIFLDNISKESCDTLRIIALKE